MTRHYIPGLPGAASPRRAADPTTAAMNRLRDTASGRITKASTARAQVAGLREMLTDLTNAMRSREISENEYGDAAYAISKKIDALLDFIQPVPEFPSRKVGGIMTFAPETLLRNLWKNEIEDANEFYQDQWTSLSNGWMPPTNTATCADRGVTGAELHRQTVKEFEKVLWCLRAAEQGLEDICSGTPTPTTYLQWGQQHGDYPTT